MAAVLLIGRGDRADAKFGDPPPTLHVSSMSGRPGTVITLSGERATVDGEPFDRMSCIFTRSIDNPDLVGYRQFAKFPVNPDGTWQGQITVGADAPNGYYNVGALGSYDGDDAFYSTEPAYIRFTVYGSFDPPPATTAPATTTQQKTTRPTTPPTRPSTTGRVQTTARPAATVTSPAATTPTAVAADPLPGASAQ